MMHVIQKTFLAVAACSFVFSACGGTGPESTLPGEEVRSDEQRITQPADTDVPELVAGNTAFALDMYRALADGDDDNLFFSPHSISVALAMTWAGARGETASQMADTLHFTLGREALHPAFDWLDLALSSRGQGASGKDGEPFRLHVVNKLFGQAGYAFLQEFLDTLALYYGAGLHLLDFAADPDGGRRVINAWVEEQTEDRIEELLPQGSISDMTRLVLVNAIYFNAAWREVFDDEQTHDAAFYRPDGSEVTVPMMHHPNAMNYGAGDDWEAVEIPFDGDELSMVVIVPSGELAAFEQELDEQTIAAVFAGLGSDIAHLEMPRFSIDGETISLKDLLEGLGMEDAFVSGAADFSGMDGTRDLFISDVLHQAFVAVDEYGTEAAAATAVVMEMGAAPQQLVVDRPFIFLIRDLATDAILFIGRVTDPTAGR